MRLRATILKFLLFSCVFCVIGGGNAIATEPETQLASTSYVDGTIQRGNGGGVVIKNASNTPVTLSQNPQTSGTVDTTSREVVTVGWTDTNRTSKVKSGGSSSTTLVDMWIE